MLNELPNLKIEVPYLLIRRVKGSLLSKEELQEFVEDLKKFESLVEKYKQRILITISNLIGLEWEEKDIIIYPFPRSVKIPSMAFPLIISLKKDPYFSLYCLVHELCHRFVELNKNLYEISFKKDKLKGEAFAEFLAIEVSNRIFGKVKAKELHEKEKKIVTTRNMEESSKLVEEFRKKYDLNKRTLFEYLRDCI